MYEQIQQLTELGMKLPAGWGTPSEKTQEFMQHGPIGDRGNEAMEGGKSIDPEP